MSTENPPAEFETNVITRDDPDGMDSAIHQYVNEGWRMMGAPIFANGEWVLFIWRSTRPPAPAPKPTLMEQVMEAGFAALAARTEDRK